MMLRSLEGVAFLIVESRLRPIAGGADMPEEASPITSASADDPPVVLFYSEPDQPLPVGAPPGRGIHHPRFGAVLKDRLEPMGVECVVRRRKDLPRQEDPKEAMFREMGDFFVRHLPGASVSRTQIHRYSQREMSWSEEGQDELIRNLDELTG